MSRVRTYIDAGFRDNKRLKLLGAKWDRKVRRWFVPDEVERAIFGAWIKDHPSYDDRSYLAVGVGERELVKSRGAIWDAEARCWYVKGPIEDALHCFLPDVETSGIGDVSKEFRVFLLNLGFDPQTSFVLDGKKCRAPVHGDRRGKRSGEYVCYLNGVPAGFAKNYRTGRKASWKHSRGELSERERIHLNAEIAQRVHERKKSRALLEERASYRARAILDGCSSQVVSQHPYAQRKGIESRPGIFLSSDGRSLFIPIYDIERRLMSLQIIDCAGEKEFLHHGRKFGCFHVIDRSRLADADSVIVCEGYATGCSIRKVSSAVIVVAFDAGNLRSVAAEIRLRYPDLGILIAGDNDGWTDSTWAKNRGRRDAINAALAVGGLVALPHFTSSRFKPSASDFDDLIRGQTAEENERLGEQFRELAERARSKVALEGSVSVLQLSGSSPISESEEVGPSAEFNPSP